MIYGYARVSTDGQSLDAITDEKLAAHGTWDCRRETTKPSQSPYPTFHIAAYAFSCRAVPGDFAPKYNVSERSELYFRDLLFVPSEERFSAFGWKRWCSL